MFNMFKPSPKYWITPGGPVYTLYEDMAASGHMLIAGATGSGKSVIINGILSTVIHDSPAVAQLILIDPKQVELYQYSSLPHCIAYGSTGPDMIRCLNHASNVIAQRLQEMRKRGERNWTGPKLYIVIDELADLLTVSETKKQALPILQHILQTGRAAGITVIAATQTTIATVIPTQLKCNFSGRVGLRTATAQDSRNIIAQTGCELLPDPKKEHRSQCYWRDGATLTKWNVPMIPDSEINALVSWWTSRQCVA